MADFAPDDQILKMVKNEYLKIVSNINEYISWDQAGISSLSYSNCLVLS